MTKLESQLNQKLTKLKSSVSTGIPLTNLNTLNTLNTDKAEEGIQDSFTQFVGSKILLKKFAPLFVQSDQLFNRSLLGQSDAAILDSLIDAFLLQLSPIFLKHSTLLVHLIKKYEAHLWNRDALIYCILPYYSTSLFNQIINLIDFRSMQYQGSKFEFLSHAINTRITKEVLVKQLLKNNDLFIYLLKMNSITTDQGIANEAHSTFILTTLAKYYTDVKEITDSDLWIIIPVLQTGLESGKINERAVMQMILLVISKKVEFEQDVLDTLLRSLILHSCTKTDDKRLMTRNAILCLVSVAQSQNTTSLNCEIILDLLLLPDFNDLFIELDKEYRVDKFIVKFAQSLVALIVSGGASRHATPALINIFKVLSLSTEVSRLIITHIIDTAFTLANPSLTSLITDLQAYKYIDVDECINSYLVKLPEQQKCTFFTLFNERMYPMCGDSTLLFSLQHPVETIRAQAIKKFVEIVDDGSSVLVKAAAPILLDLLRDSKEIAGLVLDCTLLTEICDPSTLLEECLRICSTCTYPPASRVNALEICLDVWVGLGSIIATHTLIGCLFDLCGLEYLRRNECTIFRRLFDLLFKVEGIKVPKFDLDLGVEEIDAPKFDLGVEEIDAPKFDLADSKLSAGIEENDPQAEHAQPSARKTQAVILEQVVASITAITRTSSIHNAQYFIKATDSSIKQMQMISLLVVNQISSVGLLSMTQTLEYLLYLEKSISKYQSICEIDFDEHLDHVAMGVSSKDALDNFHQHLLVRSFIELSKHIPALQTLIWSVSSDQVSYIKIMRSFITHLPRMSLRNQQSVLSVLMSDHFKSGVLEYCFAIYSRDCTTSTILILLGILNSFVDVMTKSRELKDVQLLIPFVLLILSNKDKIVRSGGLKLLKSLKNLYASIQSLDGDSKKINLKRIYGYLGFYGCDTNLVQFLDVKSIVSFIGSLLENGQSFSDPEYLSLNLGTILRARQSKRSKESILIFLISNIKAVESREHKLEILDLIEGVRTPLKVRELYSLIGPECGRLTLSQSPDFTFVNRLITSFTTIDDSFQKINGPIFLSFMHLLTNHDSIVEIECSLAALSIITVDWFASLNLNLKQKLFGGLIDGCALGVSRVNVEMNNCMQRIVISPEILEPKLELILESLQAQTESKRSKADDGLKVSKIDILTTLLEFIQSIEVIGGYVTLVPRIVTALDGLLNITNEPASSIEYCKQLILEILRNIVKVARTDQIAQDLLRADLIVQCIRITDNPQTHNAALLLLAAIGKLYPDIVLLNIMPVFTFMGANILRQDDNYSFHVVQQTLATIIPSLLDNTKDQLMQVKGVLDVFVNAIPHVPSHRRLKLFTILAQTVGVESYLGLLITLLLAHPLITVDKTMIGSGEPVNVRKFSLLLLQQFEYSTQLGVLESMMRTFADIPDSHAVVSNQSVIDQSLKTRTLRLIKLHVVQFINNTLKSFNSELNEDISDHVCEMNMKLIESQLVAIEEIKFVKGVQTPMFEKYANLLLNVLYDNLKVVNSLLSLGTFLKVIDRLLLNDDTVIKQKSMFMLQDRVKVLDHSINPAIFDTTIETLSEVLTCPEDSSEVLENKQHALLTLSVLSTFIGSKKLEVFSKLLELVIGPHGLLHPNPAVFSTCMMALGSFLRAIGPRSIPYLQRLVTKVLDHIQQAITHKTDASVIVIQSALVCLEGAADSIPQFMSSYLPRIITILSSPEFINIASEDVKKSTSTLIMSLCAKIEHRVIFPLVKEQIKPLMEMGSSSFAQGVYILSQIVSLTNQPQLVEFSNDWTKLFIYLFGYQMIVPDGDQAQLDSTIISLFITYTMKLNESSFKPLFMKIVDWGLNTDSDKNKLFMFKIIHALLDNLKSIFVPYFAIVIDSAITIINCVPRDRILWDSVMHCFLSCFSHDNNGFVNQDRFDKIAVPLVQQLEVEIDDPSYEEYVTSLLVPTIGNLAKACIIESCWKTLNKIVLMKTRSDVPSVRWAALSVVSDLYSKLGEDMLVFFPETIPFLAELMEDDDPRVEQLCQKVCEQIEVYLGEPIEQYFKSN